MEVIVYRSKSKEWADKETDSGENRERFSVKSRMTFRGDRGQTVGSAPLLVLLKAMLMTSLLKKAQSKNGQGVETVVARPTNPPSFEIKRTPVFQVLKISSLSLLPFSLLLLFYIMPKTSTRNKHRTDGSQARSKQKLFQCTGFGDCKMVFTRSEHLARHARKHTGEVSFPREFLNFFLVF